MAQNGNKKKQSSINRNELNNISLTPRQVEFFKTIQNNTITFVQGPAGSSKTFTSCYAALRAIAEKKVKKIVLVKPIQESGGEKLGSLPGELAEKINPYLDSFRHNFEKIIGRQAFQFMADIGEIEFKPLAYMRGNTFDESFIFADEAQNMDYKALMMIITRLGRDSKLVLSGDVSQYDIRKNSVAMPTFIEMVNDVDGVGQFSFTKDDIVRNKILVEIADRYDKWRIEKNL
jgi:phosphate starvation-inducible PhoH-like protein